MKKIINNKLKLAIPTEKGQYVLYTDASDIGISGVLNQVQNGKEVPILCISKKLSLAQRKYAVVEKECLAIVWAINRLQKYLLGNHFVIRSDHKALQWLLHNHTGLSRLGRWALSLQGYSFTVIHITGTLNNAADYFSRNFIE